MTAHDWEFCPKDEKLTGGWYCRRCGGYSWAMEDDLVPSGHLMVRVPAPAANGSTGLGTCDEAVAWKIMES